MDPSNYTHVLLLPLISKIFEKIKYYKMIDYLFSFQFSDLKSTSQGIVHFLWSVDAPKTFCQLIASIFLFSQYFVQ